ncbi:MAG: hypothetical protein E6G32_02675 [Actinobacteria bacterium]|jgi:hypothetical protein|nr:MAG: hypothetical protein E6G64_03970 [Actinomycetota bacterium]TML24860.1 MAG: hypothetical protein E6G32_02675 [Actinomycetota bacterium]
MVLRRPGALTREALLATGAAASFAAVLLWAGPPGNDIAAHVYQRALFLKHGFVLWNNFWYAGRYSFITYSVLYYPLSALLGIKVLALASVTVAALAFAVVIGREWGPAGRWSSRTFAVLWAGTVFSAAFPFALGVALALLALWTLQEGKRGRFAVLVVLTLAASPLAFLFLVLVLAGLAVTRRPRRSELALPAAVIGLAILSEVVLMRLFPESGHFPFHPEQLILSLSFCVLGALMTRAAHRARPLLGLFLVYFLTCVFSFAIPTELGSNIERLRYVAIPLALLAVSVAGWRPLAVALPLLAVAGIWNVKPLVANYQRAAADPAASVRYWQPAISFLDGHLSPSYRVEVVDTLEHWPAVYFPEAGVPIVRGWYRQNDFPANELLYDEQLGPRAYQRWLRSLGVEYVVLSDAPPDYSSRAEARLLRSGASGLRPVFYSPTATVYAVPHATGVVTGPAAAEVRTMEATRLSIHVAAAGRYRVAVKFSPYWRTFEGCVSRAPDGMTRLTAFRPGRVDVEFNVNVHRGLEALTGTEPARFCRG